MKVKVCGITNNTNLSNLCRCGLDMIGFNFYEKSKRFVSPQSQLDTNRIPAHIKKVGVFVNAELNFLKSQKEKFALDYLQLHGDEEVSYVQQAQEIAPIIKVFRIDKDFDFESTEAYSFSDLFLFDTFTKSYGGSGRRFDWLQLQTYKGSTPFLLAGGINLGDTEQILKLDHQGLFGVDINSGFEISPGVKNESEVRMFTQKIK